MRIEVELAQALGCGVDDPRVTAVAAVMDPLGSRNRRIYDLRASGVPAAVIALRFVMTRQHVHRVIRGQLLAMRRAG